MMTPVGPFAAFALNEAEKAGYNPIQDSLARAGFDTLSDSFFAGQTCGFAVEFVADAVSIAKAVPGVLKALGKVYDDLLSSVSKAKPKKFEHPAADRYMKAALDEIGGDIKGLGSRKGSAFHANDSSLRSR